MKLNKSQLVYPIFMVEDANVQKLHSIISVSNKHFHLLMQLIFLLYFQFDIFF